MKWASCRIPAQSHICEADPWTTQLFRLLFPDIVPAAGRVDWRRSLWTVLLAFFGMYTQGRCR